MRHLPIVFLFPLLAFAAPTPESLFQEANDLFVAAKLPYGQVTESSLTTCLEKSRAAQKKLDDLFNSHPDHTITHSMDALRLKGKIKARLSQCEKIRKDSNKRPYEPKNRGHTANF